MQKLIGVVLALGAVSLGAQEEEQGARLYPFVEIGAAWALPATLADRQAAGIGTDPLDASFRYREALKLRADGQWALAAQGRVPLGASRRWAVDAFVARYRGTVRATGALQRAGTGVGGATTSLDSVDYRLGGVTSWRATLSAVRAVPLTSALTGAVLLGGTWGAVRSADAACTATSCPPVLRLSTPGVSLGAEAFTRPWRGIRVRLAAKADALSIDEAEVRRDFRWSALDVVPAGGAEPRWRVSPTFIAGVEFRLF